MSGAEVLHRPLYEFRDVDAILGLPQGTARRWIDGYEREGVRYEPVVRRDSLGTDSLVTWGEFVETYYLARLRNHDLPVPMPRIRNALERLRRRWGLDYVFAHERVLYADRDTLEVVKAIQDEEGLDDFLVEILSSGQLALAVDARKRLERIEFKSGVAARLRPRPDIDSVYVEGDANFGRPTVIGTNINPKILAELVQSGDSVELVSELYNVSPTLVHDAGRFVYGTHWRLAAAQVVRSPRVRYLFDGGMKGVGSLIAEARPDAAVIGDSRSGIPDVKDEDWFPEAGRRKLIVIRRDADVLNQRSAERRLWERSGLRGFVLTLNNPQVWDELLVVVRFWDGMERHVSDRDGEFGWVARIHRGGVRPG